ncbi:MAG: hypothetical protein ACRDI0_05870 [Actinomycetota bacterium]
MDQQRLEELVAKRDAEGLTREEADELGKLLAEQAGEPYANADDLRGDEEEIPAAWQNPKLEEQAAGELEEQRPGQEPGKRDAPDSGAGAQKGSLPGTGPQPDEP